VRPLLPWAAHGATSVAATSAPSAAAKRAARKLLREHGLGDVEIQ